MISCLNEFQFVFLYEINMRCFRTSSKLEKFNWKFTEKWYEKFGRDLIEKFVFIISIKFVLIKNWSKNEFPLGYERTVSEIQLVKKFQ